MSENLPVFVIGKSLVFSGLYPSISLGYYVPQSQGTVVDDTGECLLRSRRDSRAHSCKKVGRLSNNGPRPCKCYGSEEKDFLNACVITLRGKASPMHMLQL